MTARWTEAADIATQVEEANDAWRDEIRSQRNADSAHRGYWSACEGLVDLDDIRREEA